MPQAVLIVDDESSIREMIAFSLYREGFAVYEAENAETAYQLICQQSFAVVLIDWMMPGTSGLALIRRIKRDKHLAALPVIMLTAKSEDSDKVLGLDAGADDYVTKPFSPAELLARIRAVTRRSQQPEDDAKLRFDAMVLDLAEHRCTIGEAVVSLGPTEFKLLHFFLSHIGRVYSRGQLLDHIWGHNAYVEERTVDVHVLRLRKSLKPFGFETFLQTVRGVGYRFSAS